MDDDRVILDRKTIKALGVESRLSILQLLDEKPRTLSELAEALALQPPSVKEHLDALLAAELIKKEQTTRKWKYYSLTLKGRRIIRPTTTKVMFALFVATLVGVFGVGFYVMQQLMEKSLSGARLAVSSKAVAEDAMIQKTMAVTSTTLAYQQGFSSFAWLFLLFFALLIFCVGLWWLVLQPKRKMR